MELIGRRPVFVTAGRLQTRSAGSKSAQVLPGRGEQVMTRTRLVAVVPVSLLGVALAAAIALAPPAWSAEDNVLSGAANTAGDVSQSAGNVASDAAVGAGNAAGTVAGPIPRKAGEVAGDAANAAGHIAKKTLDLTSEILRKIF
jgi:hypothetical protein